MAARLEPSLVFDIGLHLGEDTAFYLRKGYQVAAFEANPALVAHCRERFSKDIGDGRLTIHEGVLKANAAERSVPFYVNARNTVWGTAVTAWRDRNAHAFAASSTAIQVRTVDLAAVIGQIGVPYFAKIDVEGSDREILEGFAQFPVRPPFVSIESTMESLDALEDEIHLLKSLGYRRFKALQQRTIPGSVVTGRTLQGAPFSHRFERHASGPFGEDLTGWTDSAGILDVYRAIFLDYARYGETSRLHRALGRMPVALLQLFVGRPLPGWYDTHARLD